MRIGELGALANLVRAVRRRLRAVWAWDTAQALAPLAAGVALLLVLAGWVLPWAWTDWAALALAAGLAGAVVVTAMAARLPDLLVARAADRGLATRDAFSTALELPADVEHFGSRVRERAVRLAADARPADAVPVRWRRRALLVAAILTPLAVVLALTANPQDARREERARERAAVAAIADDVAADADQLRADPAAVEAARRLDELAAELRATDDLGRAEELANKMADELARTQTAESLAARAAVQGLTQSLDQEPLPGARAGQDAASQLGALAAAVGSLGIGEREALADRLDDLAATQQVGDPATATALAAAADALRQGDLAAAQDALADAASANAATAATAAGTAALGEAAATARHAADAAAGPASSPSDSDSTGEARGEGEGQGAGQGQDQGEGRGEGDGDGEGQGSGQGQGQGDGSGGRGSGGAGGSPSGDVSGGGTGGDTDASGQGGQGQGTGSAGGTEGEVPALDSETVYDPGHGDGDQLVVGGGEGAGEGGTVGTTGRAHQRRFVAGAPRRGHRRVPPAGDGGDGPVGRRAVRPPARALVLRPVAGQDPVSEGLVSEGPMNEESGDDVER